MTLPSGPGQTDKAHSESVAIASDQDAIPIKDAPAATGLTKTLPPVTVGTSAVAVGTGTAKAGVLVQSQRANTVNVYVGASDVVVGAGLELAPGDSGYLEVSDVSTIYAIASAAGQKVAGLVL